MRPRLILLFVLATLTVGFMAFLVNGQGPNKAVCAKGNCCGEQNAPKPVETGGGGGMDDGSFHHLIVSTIK